MVRLLPASLLAATAAAMPSQRLIQRQNASCEAIPSGFVAATDAKLPDPFTFASGKKVATQADWACRQQQISQLFQTYELGTLPGPPDKFTASYSGNTLSMTATVGSNSITFTATVSLPSGSGPHPVIITFNGASLPIPNTIGQITFNNDDMAAQASSSSRGQGKFYNLYGSGHSAGAMMAWAWGVSRIIDALEKTPSIAVDLNRIGVTGCSRNGKGAFVAGAFDSRIALTLPQESGSGGAACWRISDDQKSKGANIQTASEIVGENVWFSTAFNAWTSKTSALAIDHHELAGLVAPRGLFVIENDIDWLGPVSTNGCMKVGRVIYKAVGAPDAMGFSQSPNHAHCSFPSSQQANLTLYMNKYLLNQNVNTAGVEYGTYTVAASDWMDWTPPTITS